MQMPSVRDDFLNIPQAEEPGEHVADAALCDIPAGVGRDDADAVFNGVVDRGALPHIFQRVKDDRVVTDQ